MRKINSKWYSYEKKPYEHFNSSFKGCLFAQAQYPTTITADDLPPSFIYGRFYKCWGYIDTAGITDMLYIPDTCSNYFLKDDRLIISYSGKIQKKDKDKYGDEYENEDYSIYGNEIIDILKGAKDYSGIDIKPFIKQIKDKVNLMKEKYPEDFNNIDIDSYFICPIKNRDCFKE